MCYIVIFDRTLGIMINMLQGLWIVYNDFCSSRQITWLNTKLNCFPYGGQQLRSLLSSFSLQLLLFHQSSWDLPYMHLVWWLVKDFCHFV